MITPSRSIDYLIGKAALSVILQKQPVSLTQLLSELRSMAASAADEDMYDACYEAIGMLEMYSVTGLIPPEVRNVTGVWH